MKSFVKSFMYRLWVMLSLVVLLGTQQADAATKNDFYCIGNNSCFYKANCLTHADDDGKDTEDSGSSGPVYILGDSITVRSADAYKTLFHNKRTLTVDGSSSRSLTSKGTDGNKLNGLDAIDKDKSTIQSAATVVIALGTNGGTTASNIDSAISKIKGIKADVQIYWVDTISVGRSDTYNQDVIGPANKAIYEEADAQGYQVISWFNEVDPGGDPQNPTKKESDSNHLIDNSDGLGVHPNDDGSKTLAKAVGDALGSVGASPDGAAGKTNACCPNTNSADAAAATPDPAAASVSLASNATAAQKIAQTFIVGFDASTSPDVIKDLVAKYHLGGIYLTGTTDAASKGFTKDFYDGLNDAAGVPLTIASDEEGGKVLRYSYTDSFPSAKSLGAKGDDDIKALVTKEAQAMKTNGITTDLAPVLDLDDGTNIIAKNDRSFDNSATQVDKKAAAFAAGLKASGVTPVYKHFPGFGGAGSGNTDTDPVRVPSSYDLDKNVKAYESAAKDDNSGIMLSNLIVPDIDTTRPISISSKAVDYLRDNMSYNGLITTDDIAVLQKYGSQAVGLSTAITKALKAGVDMPLFGIGTSDESAASTKLDAAIRYAKTNVSKDTLNKALTKIAAFKSASLDPSSVPPGTPGACCPTGSGNLTGDTPASKAFNYLVATAGYSTIVAAGIVGNMMRESAGNTENLDTHAHNDISGTHDGIVQWSTSRWAALKTYEASKGNKDEYDLATQLDYVVYDLEHNYPHTLEAMKTATDAGHAAAIFNDGPPIPAFEASNDEVGFRESNAQKIYTKYATTGGLGIPTDVSVVTTPTATCDATSGGGGAGGDADLTKTITVSSAGKFITLPDTYSCPGTTNEIDSRIAADVAYLATTYHMCVNAGLADGHKSHGVGIAVDLVPTGDASQKDTWKESTEAAARAIGWYGDGANDPRGSKDSCAIYSGDGACMHEVHPDKFPTWMRWMGYNGASCHGDPWHVFGGCGAHLHVGWDTPNHDGVSPTKISAPRQSVYAFPAPVPDDLKNLIN